MKISYNWLKNYIAELPPPDELAEMLTACGLEVESLETWHSVKGGLQGIFIGQVTECRKHPNADKLSLTKVDIGQGDLLSIVCGAPNVAEGQKVVVAKVGTRVLTAKGELTIEKTRIRGELSEGMICAEDEVGLGPSHAGIIVLPPDAPLGMEAREYFKIEEDNVFEIGLTPNRSDATSHMGVARDIYAMINLRNYEAGHPPTAMHIPEISGFKSDNDDLRIPVVVEDENACPRYSGLTISGVKVEESPEWLKNKLKAIDIRPINNIVDITQYVLFETGQPLHAFDADKIAGQKVIVKKLPKDTAFTTLDGNEHRLSGEDLMICNTMEGMCMAGVFGGEKSGVSNNTVNIFLESACFDPATIRKTSKMHNLKTDASFRFERGADINMTTYALKRSALLIKQIAGGKISSEIIDVCPGDTARKNIAISYDKLNLLAGKTIHTGIVRNILESLEINISDETSDGAILSIPTAKVDVTRDVDVFEEILRIYGYNNIELPQSLRASLSYRPKPDKESIQDGIADFLASNGFNEILTNSLSGSQYTEKYADLFPPEHDVKILNPLSRELNIMRQTLLFSGLEVIAYNQNRKNTDLKLFEFGNVYRYEKSNDPGLGRFIGINELSLIMTGNSEPESWHDPSAEADYYFLKSFVDGILNRTGIETKLIDIRKAKSGIFEENLEYYDHEKLICRFGTLNRRLIRDFDLRSNVQYACFNWNNMIEIIAENQITYYEVPKVPEVRRDLALLIDPSVTWKEIHDLAFSSVNKHLKNVNLFDVYTGDDLKGKKSYAVSFILQDDEKTLTDKEIDDIMHRLMAAYTRKLGASIR